MSGAKKKTKASADEIIIPDKLYFRIGEVSELSALPAYVLRFWESEFPHLKPTKSSTGQRMYRKRDVEGILRIKKLLYDEGYTIAGAREKLKSEAKVQRKQAVLPFAAPKPNTDPIKRLRRELQDILHLLNTSPRHR